jgi:choline dehydrogenase-like flavoprotein
VEAASSFDVVVVGGGLAGSSLAITLAREGVDVLLVERERVFRDRVRGEVMATWGTVEAKRLGLFELLLERCAIDVRYLTYHVEGVGAPLDLLAAAPHFAPSLAFHHPVMQEALLEEAAAGSRVTATSGPLSGIYAIRVCRVSGWSMRNRRGRSPRSMALTGGSNGLIGTVSSLSVMLRARVTRPGEAVSRARYATSACCGTR